MEGSVRKWASGVTMILVGPVMLASYVLWPSMLVDGERFVEETIGYGSLRATWSTVLGAVYFVAGVIALRRQRLSGGDHAGGHGANGAYVAVASIGGRDGVGEGPGPLSSSASLQAGVGDSMTSGRDGATG